jgi:hypothetical protein
LEDSRISTFQLSHLESHSCTINVEDLERKKLVPI